MTTLDVQLARLQGKVQNGYWGERIFHQLAYAGRMSKVKNGEHDELLFSVCDFLLTAQSAHGVITNDDAQHAETMLLPLAKDAKRFTMICAAHAHIDMNWMWRWDETVSVTLDTFRTMLDLMNEYPAFTFSQSQASTYRIVEEYAPEMLPEIRARVQEGRWEVTASTWVEPDKNMPSGESLTRQILYTKRYLSDLLGLDPSSLNIDFEPDTFGHSLHVPEILKQGGVKYYYHCRGYEGHNLYRWVSPSGAAVLVYREPIWYNAEIQPDMALYVPGFCTQHGMDTMLKVYGVGDHGGGPTRRDIERIQDMNQWPVFPTIRFGTFHEYFSLMEGVADQLPEVHGELNFVFTGCYTSQTRIKQANRVAEATLQEAELFDAAAVLCTGSPYRNDIFEAAWRNVLFNQFHDIIPGSGVVDTREYAMGLFQNTMAIATTNKTMAMRRIASAIDTTALFPEEQMTADRGETTSEGAGVGFGIQDFKLAQTERGRGENRIFHVFNSAPVDRNEAVEIVIWDWPGEVGRMCFKNDQGQVIEHQLLDHGRNNYWGHRYVRVLIKASVPSCGYSTYALMETQDIDIPLSFPRDPRVELEHEFVLENQFVRVVFDSRSGAISSMIDKDTKEELLKQDRPAGVFRLICEDESKGMTAWVVGRYMNVQDLVENVRVRKVDQGSDAIRDSLIIEMEFANSKLKAVVSLDYDSPMLQYNVECNWREIGKQGAGIPQLNYYVPVAYDCAHYSYDVPFGVIKRAGLDMDVPANSFAVANRKDATGKSIMLVTDSKYGFRGRDDSLAISLIRSSFDPDPYPEFGVHAFRFCLCLVEGGNQRDLVLRSYQANHPLNVISTLQSAGTLPVEQSFLRIEEGSVALSALKMPEDGLSAPQCIIRLYETEGSHTTAVLHFFKKAANAYVVDLNEEVVHESADIVRIEDGEVFLSIAPFKVASVCVEFVL